MIGEPDFKIATYRDQFRQDLLNIWEAAVMASHHFISPSDFKEIKALVQQIDFSHFEVYCFRYKIR